MSIAPDSKLSELECTCGRLNMIGCFGWAGIWLKHTHTAAIIFLKQLWLVSDLSSTQAHINAMVAWHCGSELIFSLHCQDASSARCRPLLLPACLSVCGLDMTTSPTKMAELIEMLSEWAREPCIRWDYMWMPSGKDNCLAVMGDVITIILATC